ncbi:hypothetical protein Bca4012_027171 [Brassica carinata]
MLPNRVPVRVLILHRSFNENSNVLSHGGYISSEDQEQPIVYFLGFFSVSSICWFCSGSRTPFLVSSNYKLQNCEYPFKFVWKFEEYVDPSDHRDSLLRWMLYDGVTRQEKLRREEPENSGIWDLSVKSFTYASDGHRVHPCTEMAKLSAFYFKK